MFALCLTLAYLVLCISCLNKAEDPDLEVQRAWLRKIQLRRRILVYRAIRKIEQRRANMRYAYQCCPCATY